MSPWRIRSVQEGNRYSRQELAVQGICITITAAFNFFFAFEKLLDGKAWLGVAYLAISLLLALLAVKDFVEIWKRRVRPKV